MRGKNLTIIERYLNGQMDSLEQEQFIARLGADPQFNREYEEYKAVYEAIGDHESIQLRRQLKEIAKGFEMGEGRTGMRRISHEWVWLAALLIISMSVVSVVYTLVNSPVTSHYLAIRHSVRMIGTGTYRLDPAVDNMMRYRLRSVDFMLESPRDSLVIERKSELVFRWTTALQGPFFLDILDRHGQEVFSTTRGFNSPYVLKKSIPPGVYIVRVRTATQAVCFRILYVV